ncbi:MAG TPA: ABC transporter substrate-binding protein [Desulfobacterales bacterium]|nr:ABC transporter substrate-binding protein [Desulfobacterales bacterium]
MDTFFKPVIVAMVMVWIGTASPASGKEPLDELKQPIDKVIEILRDPLYRDEAKKKLQREKIWDVIRTHFDFLEISKRSLARNWLVFTPKERKEFTEVFGDFLGEIYIDKLQGEFQDEKVVYVGQEMVSDSKALVKTTVIRKTAEIPMNYSMLKNNDGWKIYDVNIEGVSLVQNYRTQFNQTLSKESPAQLIERLRNKNQP